MSSRPRPKPIARKTKPAAPSAESSTSSGTSITSAEARRRIEEQEEQFFTKNLDRTAEAWQKLDRINKEPKHKPSPTTDSDEEADAQIAAGRKKPHKKAKDSKSTLPRWAQPKDMMRILSEDPSSDDDLEILDSSTTPNGTQRNSGKRKRARSRSRSITPPPALPQDRIQQARNVVRQTLQVAPRPPSPTTLLDIDESTDNITLDPELQRIAHEINRNPNSADGSSRSTFADRQNDGAPAEVTLKVRWMPHPLSESGKEQVWAFKMSRTDAFRDLFEETADLAHVLVDNLVLSYAGNRLFPSVTPKTLHIWAEAELQACDKATYDHLRTHKQHAFRSPHPSPSPSRSPSTSTTSTTTKTTTNTNTNGRSQTIEIDSDGDEIEMTLPAPPSSSPPTHSHSHSSSHSNSYSSSHSTANEGNEREKTKERGSSSPPQDTSDTFKLTVRSALLSKEITLTVRPTTTCAGIVKAYMKRAGLFPLLKVDKRDPRLVVDGDRMAPTAEISEADLEDGDIVDIVGLE